MVRWYPLSVLLMLSTPAFGQFFDDFSSEDLSPIWQGDRLSFFINHDHELQLSAPDAGKSLLHIPLDFNPFHWTVKLSNDFNPSNNNKTRIFLAMDKPAPETATGYFIQLGENGNEDRWHLYGVTGGEEHLLASGVSVFSENPSMIIDLSLTDHGALTLFSQATDAKAKTLEFTYALSPDLITDSTYFAIECQYTQTRKEAFRFDDLRIDTFPATESTLQLLELEVVSDHELQIIFDQDLDRDLALNTNSYHLGPGIGHPESVRFGEAESSVVLDFARSFSPEVTYELQISFSNNDGNVHQFVKTFIYSVALALKRHELLITEVYDDPTPSLGLPDAEYLELYLSPGTDPLSLAKVILSNQGNEIGLPDSVIHPGEYVIVCDDDDQEEFLPYGKVVATNGFRTLRNTGSSLEVRTMDGEVLHRITYDDSWYRDPDKNDGGWSLEMINPDNPCLLADNWAASQDLRGGTPGSENSLEKTPDQFQAFKILETRVISESQLQLITNRSLDHLPDIADFTFPFHHITVTEVTGTGPNLESIILTVDPGLESNTTYELDMTGLTDCYGNVLDTLGLEIRVPGTPEPGDVVVNEILFNPNPGGKDFVELLNVSDKSFDLDRFLLANFYGSGTDIEPIVSDKVIQPGDHLVITEDAADLSQQYNVAHPHHLIESNLPALDDDRGNVSLLYSSVSENVVIDDINYDEEFHSPFLKSLDGVSLERLSAVDHGDSEEHNWHSASRAAGYATPTAPNSQQRSEADPREQFALISTTFSPDGDGYEDFLDIQYQMIGQGNLLNILIFDVAGRKVKTLVDNYSLSNEGHITWDGSDDSGAKSGFGTYVLLFELFGDHGERNHWQETCILAGKFE